MKRRASRRRYAGSKAKESGCATRPCLCRTQPPPRPDRLPLLELAGIPVLHSGALERDERTGSLALISLAVDPFGDPLVRVAALPRYDVPLQDVHGNPPFAGREGTDS